MQSIQFVRQLNEIIKRLKVFELMSKISPLLDVSSNQEITDDLKSDIASLIFESREGYYALQQNPESKTIVDSLGISEVFNPRMLSSMLTILNTQADTAGITGVAQNFSVFQSFLSNLKVMLAFQSTLDTHLCKQKTSASGENERVIEFEIIDYDNSGLHPERLVSILKSIHHLHYNIARIIEDKGAKLTISYMDSGSDFLIGVQSGFKVIELMKTFCLQYWQKVRFRSPEEFDRNPESLAKGLNLIQHIIRQEKNGVFDSETSAKIKLAVLEEVTTLIGLGVILKDQETEERFDKRKLVLEKKDVRFILHKEKSQN